MKNRLVILTRCTRQENLPAVYESVKGAINKTHRWYVIIDLNAVSALTKETLEFMSSLGKDNFMFIRTSKPDTCGYDILNDVIKKEIPKGAWIHIVDDDNILHENLIETFENLETKAKAIVVNQQVDGKDFTRLNIREAKPENTKFQGVDVAQVLFDRDFLIENGGYQMGYCGDGLAIDKIYKDHPDKFHFIDEVLCYYNKIEKPKGGSEPRVLYVGELPKTPQAGGSARDYESNMLRIHHIKDDTNVFQEIHKINPDVIISRSNAYSDFPTLSYAPTSVRRKWIHVENIEDKNDGDAIYNAAMHAMLTPDKTLASIFTSAYNIGDKIRMTYNSLRAQTYSNWEWTIVNDSNDNGKTQKVLDELASNDPRIKVYTFEQKSKGVIGESKYRAAMLCNGQYLMELDHDDALMPDAVALMVRAFEEHPDAGFVYSDCLECDVNYNTTKYVDGFAFGYGSYYEDTFMGKKIDVNACVPVNPKTIRHIVGVPNHFRSWRRDHYHAIGGHNRGLTIADDYELVVRSFLTSRFVRIPKCCYIQYYYGQNTQDSNGGATRRDIQRRVRTIAHHYNEAIKARFEELGMQDWAYEYHPQDPLWAPSQMDAPDAAYTLKL
jgi:glycosyltransferase involved in cell wall biosynthesis